ncbi:MAG: SprB repeat-containing protein, partial [Flavobacteriales bacterium]
MILSFAWFSVFAQPANDDCNNAQNLGTLPTPAACPNGVGSTITVSGSNINATAATPYTYLLGCSTGGNQPNPALDVWYSFVASGSRVTINITGGSPALASPAITLWTGNNCNNLTGVGCDNNGTAGGSNSVTFEPLSIGQTYYIQVSGMNSTAAGNFNMAINASNDCADCNLASSLTVTPLPTNGTYLPGTQVTFCYTVTNWVQISSNWIHGIIPTFGNGWNTATLQSNGTPPPASNGYAWFFANGPLGQGWWVDLNPTGPANFDGIFTNNFGYLPTSGTGSWTWCWSITTNTNCASGTNLNMSINTTADGETGSWTSPACLDDPTYNFSAVLNCCLPPILTTTNVLCNGASTGSITATPTSGASPWDFVWTNASGTILGSAMNVTSNTISNLPAGIYNVTVTDNAGCVSTAQATITQPPPFTPTFTQVTPICSGGTLSALPT